MSEIWRRPHRLEREKSLSLPRQFIIVDTETSQTKLPSGAIEQRLRLGWAVLWRRPHGRHLERVEWCYFEEAPVFWSFVMKHHQPKTRLWVLARNLVFDFTVLGGWTALRENGFKRKFFYSDGVTSIISVHKGSFSLVFIDILNYFVESLAKTGERIGKPKMEVDFTTCTQEQLSVYGKNDVEIELLNWQGFVGFLQTQHLARLRYTRGSTAMSCFLLNHYKGNIWIHNNKEALDLEREAYKGGRVECFRLGDIPGGPFFYLDVNSLYPYVMQKYQYPCKFVQNLHRPSVDDLRAIVKDHTVVARVLIETTQPVYALKRGRTIFPVGRFWVSLCTPEIEYALRAGHVVAVRKVTVYERDYLFKTYVTDLYERRKRYKADGNKEYETICKGMLNSLYGKFGQKAEEWKKIGNCPDEPDRIEDVYDVKTKRRTRYMYMLGEVFERVRVGESFNSFPAIAAHVTAYGRMVLWRFMRKAGRGHYFYCDTDSLIVDKVGRERLQTACHDTQLGKLKQEEKTKRLHLRGLKDYATDSKDVLKGVRKGAKQVGPNRYKQEHWPSFRGILRRPSGDCYTVDTCTKHLNREYTKGQVAKTGLITPFVLDDVLGPL